ncbi:MAG TPA: hypothetical protein VGS18_04440 [Thermoplasmata archaeon]|nr:hypothetical protein [Thermoplasmata archaeon]
MSARAVRLAISLEPELQRSLDRWVAGRQAASRSDAVRFLIRQELAGRTLSDPDAPAVGTLTLLFHHGDRNVERRLTLAEHRWGPQVRSSTHVHLGDGGCVEALILVGTRREITAAAEDLRGVKGIVQGKFEILAVERSHGHPTADPSPAPRGRTSQARSPGRWRPASA